MYLERFSQASFEGIWLGKVDGEATVNRSMDVLHGEQEAELFSEHSYMLKAGDGDYMYVVKWLKHSLVPRLPHTGIVKVEAACMVLPNRGKFSLMQIFAEMCPNPSEEIFTVLFSWNESVML